MSIEVGNKVSGKVTGITNFGAFIDLGGGKTGLVHISEISDTFVKEIKDVLKVGDEVTVKVMSIADDGKIGLSIRKAVDKPAGEVSRPQRESRPYQKSTTPRPEGSFSKGRKDFSAHQDKALKNDFDSLMSSFLKDSEDRLTSIKRNTEGKRGGRGGRRG